MENAHNYLFVYGSLLDNDNEFGHYLKNNSRCISKGSFTGLLYDMGEYPGAIYDAAANNKVFGDVVLLNSNPGILNIIDEYEGYGDTQPQPYLFVRKLLPIQTLTGTLNCWVYLYNLPVTGHRQITSGRYKT